MSGVPTGAATVPSRVLAPGGSARTVVAPLAFGVVFVGAWQASSSALGIDPYVVPAPVGDPRRGRGQPRLGRLRRGRTPG